MRVLGVDPSLTRTGACMIDTGLGGHGIVQVGSFKPGSKATRNRAIDTTAWLVATFDLSPCRTADLVIVEWPEDQHSWAGKMSATGVGRYGALCGYVAGRMLNFAMDLEITWPSQWLAQFPRLGRTGGGRDKPDRVRYIREHLGYDPHERIGPDEADAILIATYGAALP